VTGGPVHRIHPRGSIARRKGSPSRSPPETLEEAMRPLAVARNLGGHRIQIRPASGVGWVSWLTAAYRDSLLEEEL